MKTYSQVEGILYGHYRKKNRIANLKSRQVRTINRIESLRRDLRECNIDLGETMKGIDYSRDMSGGGGVRKSDIKVKLGQSYRIERVKKSVRDWNEFTGKCIHETKDHVTIKNKTRAETFLKVDFLIGEYRIKEIA